MGVREVTINMDAQRFRIGDLTLDCTQRQLSRDGKPIALGPRTFRFLCALVRVSPHIATPDTLRHDVWEGRFVTSTTIAQRVRLLRAALGDDSSQPTYVAMVRGTGYRLIPPVVPLGALGHDKEWVEWVRISFRTTNVLSIERSVSETPRGDLTNEWKNHLESEMQVLLPPRLLSLLVVDDIQERLAEEVVKFLERQARRSCTTRRLPRESAYGGPAGLIRRRCD